MHKKIKSNHEIHTQSMFQWTFHEHHPFLILSVCQSRTLFVEEFNVIVLEDTIEFEDFDDESSQNDEPITVIVTCDDDLASEKDFEQHTISLVETTIIRPMTQRIWANIGPPNQSESESGCLKGLGQGDLLWNYAHIIPLTGRERPRDSVPKDDEHDWKA